MPSNIFTTGSFDLTSGTGTQTVVDCLGPALLCSDIVIGSTAFCTVQALAASDPDVISWQVDVVLGLGGTFGTADSMSTFLATRADRAGEGWAGRGSALAVPPGPPAAVATGDRVESHCASE